MGDAVTAAPNASDGTSGVAAQSCGSPDTTTPGAHTVTCSATDAAGNQATQTLAYTVAARSGPTPPAATTYRITRVKVARNGNLTFRLTASRSGRVRVGAKAGKVKFRSVGKRLTGRTASKVTLKLSRKARRAFLRKLRGGKRVRVKLTITPARGSRKTFTRRVRRGSGGERIYSPGQPAPLTQGCGPAGSVRKPQTAEVL